MLKVVVNMEDLACLLVLMYPLFFNIFTGHVESNDRWEGSFNHGVNS